MCVQRPRKSDDNHGFGSCRGTNTHAFFRTSFARGLADKFAEGLFSVVREDLLDIFTSDEFSLVLMGLGRV